MSFGAKMRKLAFALVYPNILFALLVVLLLYAFLVAPVTVSLDGYSHLYGAEALRWMLGGQPDVHRSFSYNSLLLPNWLCALLLAALSTIVSNELALKLLVVLIGTALISSLYFCIDATLYHHHQRAQVLIVLLPFALNGYLTLGFYGFLISSSMCIFVLGLLLRHGLTMPVRLQCVTASLLLLAYLSNPLPVIISFLFPCAFSMADAIIHWRGDRSRSAAAPKLHAVDIWPWLAPACMLPWFYLRLSKAAAGSPAESMIFKLTHRTVGLARDAVLYISPTENVGTLFIALLSIISAGVVLCSGKRFVQNRFRFTSLAVLIVSTMVLYLVAPDYVGDGAHIANRFLFHSVLFLVLLALASGVFNDQLLTLCSIIAALSVIGFVGEYLLLSKHFAPAVAEVRGAMEMVPRHSRILIMGYRMTPSSYDGWPLLKRTIPERHWAMVGALKNELIVLNDYEANASHFPLEYLTRRYSAIINEVDLGIDLSAEQNRAAWLEVLNSDPDVNFIVSWGISRGVDWANSVYSPFDEPLKRRYDKVFSKQGASRVEIWQKRR